MALGITAHPSRAYLTPLAGTWEEFYAVKCSAAARWRDRTKRKRLVDFGAVQLVTPESDPEIGQTLDRLMAQKAGKFARIHAVRHRAGLQRV